MENTQIFIEKKSELITAEEIAEIENHYGKSIAEIESDYGLSPVELLNGIQKSKADDERRRNLQLEDDRRQTELANENRAECEQRRERFENILRHRFLEANERIGVNESDFQRLLPKLLDDEMMSNYHRLIADDNERTRKDYADVIS